MKAIRMLAKLIGLLLAYVLAGVAAFGIIQTIDDDALLTFISAIKWVTAMVVVATCWAMCFYGDVLLGKVNWYVEADPKAQEDIAKLLPIATNLIGAGYLMLILL